MADPHRAGLLFARGLDAEHRGDFSAARRFYSTAARQGDAAAARNLGRLYDPAYLRQTALGGVDPDPELARFWYDFAIRLGDTGAAPLLEALSSR
jgi:TPR repeat protein